MRAEDRLYEAARFAEYEAMAGQKFGDNPADLQRRMQWVHEELQKEKEKMTIAVRSRKQDPRDSSILCPKCGTKREAGYRFCPQVIPPSLFCL